MITEERIIHYRKPAAMRPIAIAKACYDRWLGDQDLIDDLDDYHLTGVVVSGPNLFVLAKAIEDPHPDHRGELAWFIRMYVGRDMVELLAALPAYPIKRICFCRRNDGRVRSYSIERMLRLAEKQKAESRNFNFQLSTFNFHERTNHHGRIA